MPIRNEEAFIARSLGAVLTQDYPPERLQVLVADGMSDDRTRAVVDALSREHPAVDLAIVDNPGRTAPTGFNAALERAHGEVIVRVDGHTVVAEDYVRECVAALRRSGAENVGGRMDAVGEGPVAEAIALATSSRFGIGNSAFHYAEGERWVDSVYMGAWPRTVFDRFGGFDPELVRDQDDEFNYRLRAGGGRILLTDRIRSTYYGRGTLRAVFRQYREYGLWKVRVLRLHPGQTSVRHLVPPAFVASLAAGAVLVPAGRGTRRAWVLLIGSYAVASTAASASVARRAGWRHLPLLPVIFAALHVGYGAGFLGGIARLVGGLRRAGRDRSAAGRAGATGS